MKTDLYETYQAAQTLIRAFSYLQPRMQGGGPQAQPMNAEALAGCVLHGCLARLLGEIRRQQWVPGMGLTA